MFSAEISPDDRFSSPGIVLIYPSDIKDHLRSMSIDNGDEAPGIAQPLPRSPPRHFMPLLHDPNNFASQPNQEKPSHALYCRSTRRSHTPVPLIAPPTSATSPSLGRDGITPSCRLLQPLQPSISFPTLDRVTQVGVFSTSRTMAKTPTRENMNTSRTRHRIQQRSSTDKATNSQQAIVINLSAKDKINPARVARSLQNSRSPSRPYFINTTLAMVTALPSTKGKHFDEDKNADPRDVSCNIENRAELTRQVHIAASTSYWAGRYMGLCDKLHNSKSVSSQLDTLKSSRRAEIPSEADLEFDQAETRRKEEALLQLRGHCKTQDALKSFDAFEHGLRLANRSLSPVKFDTHPNVRQSSIHPIHKYALSATFRPSHSIGPNISPPSSSTATALSSVHAEMMVYDRSDLPKKSQMSKSKTLGNLNARVLSSQNFPRAKQSSIQSATTLSRARAVQEREMRPSAGMFQAAHRISSTSAIGRKSVPSSDEWISRPVARKQAEEELCLQSGGNDPTKVTALSTGKASSKKIANATADSSANISRRHHKSESMKRFVDAGLREVIKMGRRVGSTSTGTPTSIG